MNIMINASNLRIGGGVQTADSILRELHKFPQHSFVVVYSDALQNTADVILGHSNIMVIRYNLPKTLKCLITKRERFLDKVVKEHEIEFVLTIFGPSRWTPKVPHLCGFADAHCIHTDTPFWKILPWKQYLYLRVYVLLLSIMFYRSSKLFYTENATISEILKQQYHLDRVYTVTNYYNQVFDDRTKWDRSIKLPKYNGMTILTVASNYPHKNLGIIRDVLRHLKENRPAANCRFVLTIEKTAFQNLTHYEEEHIIFLGAIAINQCPYLYEQSDVMLLPSLMECFSATYAEAMVMHKPIITTDLDFAHGLCGEAALYYEALNSEDLAKCILALEDNEQLHKDLVKKGEKQLLNYDNYKHRAEKLMKIMEKEYSSR